MQQRLGGKWLLGMVGQEALLPVYYGRALCTETVFLFLSHHSCLLLVATSKAYQEVTTHI